MAYRGGDTDPLGRMIDQQRTMRRIVLFIALLWVAPMVLNVNWSTLSGMFVPPVAAPAAPVAPATPAAPAASGAKMAPKALERVLAGSLASNGAPLGLMCTAGMNGWDYVCTYRTSERSPARLKMGVRVSATSVLQASPPVRFESPLPGPFPGR